MQRTLLRFAVGCLALVAFLTAGSLLVAQEQTGEIRGTVSEAGRAEVLVGANVLVDQTNLGASTNLEGQYSIRRVPPGRHTVRARYVGYKEQVLEVTVVAGRAATLDFALTATAVQLGEVIVTGQGVATEKRRLPSVVEAIAAKEIDMVSVKSVDVLLQGRIPGLTGFQQGGSPGQGARMMTRGIKAALSQTTPVIYVDGVRVDNSTSNRLGNGTGGTVSSSLTDLVTGDIDRIEVIKGGAAATLYGSEAANGVIQIFTKKGVPGAIRWTANVTTGYDIGRKENVYSDYTKEKFFQDGFFQSYRLGATGGSDIISYNISGRMSENKGVMIEDKLQERLYSLSSGVRVVVSELASVEFSANYSRNSWGKIYNDNSTLSLLSNMEIEGRFDISLNKDSLLALHLLPEFGETSNRFIFTSNFSYLPFSWWDNRFTVGLDYRKSEDRLFAPVEAGAFVGTPGGYLNRADREYKTLTLAYTGSIKVPDLGPVSQKLVFGYQAFRVDDREVRGTGTTFKIPGTKDFDNASVRDGQESNQELFSYGFILQDQIGLFNRIFMDVGVRFDGNSTFGKNIGIQTYPKVGVAYNVSEESFWPEAIKPYVSSLKLRASWGQTGSFPPPFTRDRQYLASGYMADVGINFGNPGNKDLKPEKTAAIDAGVDAGFFGDRLSVEFTYFQQVTKDAMFSVTEDPAAGLGFQRRNVGEIENKGIELSVRGLVLDEEDVQLNMRASMATLNNKVTSLGGAAGFTVAGFLFAPSRVEEGQPVGVIRASKPRLEADGTYRGNYDDVFIGTPTPKVTGSASFELTLFRDITVTSLFEGAWGHYILNQSLSRRIVNALNDSRLYQEEIARIPKVEAGSIPYTRNTASIVLVEKGDWLKWREVAVRYRLPRSLMSGVAITASVRNVLSFGIKATHVDPETSFIPSGTIELGGIVGATVEAPRQFRVGIDVTL